MNKPKEIELFEKFIQFRHKLGASAEEIAVELQNAMMWFAQTQLDDEIDTNLERNIAEKVTAITNRAMLRYVGRVLNS